MEVPMLFGKYINKYYLKHLPLYLLGIASLVAVDYFQLVVPELYQMTVNGMNTGFSDYKGELLPFDMDFLLDKICLPMIIVILIMVVGRFLWRICFFGTAIRIETDLRGRMFDHCKNLPQEFYQKNKVGNLMSLFTNDLETIHECTGMGVMELCDALLLGTMSIVKMASMNITLTLLSLIPMALLLAGSLVMVKYLAAKWDRRQAAFSDLSDFAQENFSGIAVIKAFVKETKELLAFKKLNVQNEDTNVDYTRLSTLMRIFLTLFVESVVCVILGYGGYLVYEGVFNAGQLVEFIGYFTAIVWPIMAVSEIIDLTSRGKASLKRISELLDVDITVRDGEKVKDIGEIKGNIEFRGLSFRYPDGEFDVLENVSFSINAGESVGIIGKTGSGKTTLVDLLLRTYNVPDGTIFLDGTDINEIPIKTVRRYAAYVPQDNFLFSDTIENNISFAADGGGHAEVERAALMADIHENISEFPEKYQTVLGERGVTVSGGQKQRISIARALMKDANILIMDDSVSAVDVKTEKTILENLKKLRCGKTTLLIAHRISTVKDMDKIIFLDDGRVTAVGRHDELYASCHDYRVMVDLQKLDDAEMNEGSVAENA